ncbi:hypothetical protein AAFF_G00080500 [Aldrovandia affinis]|uniref:Uncharacterized protein n=1 Tax=Aldrovandia affinis TaxID=143900 RepID=A0AAD7T387_9TELE|nr:hypothetical protein AAFF_G00080500 [Aldrovandia affinis]
MWVRIGAPEPGASTQPATSLRGGGLGPRARTVQGGNESLQRCIFVEFVIFPLSSVTVLQKQPCRGNVLCSMRSGLGRAAGHGPSVVGEERWVLDRAVGHRHPGSSGKERHCLLLPQGASFPCRPTTNPPGYLLSARVETKAPVPVLAAARPQHRHLHHVRKERINERGKGMIKEGRRLCFSPGFKQEPHEPGLRQSITPRKRKVMKELH